MDFALDEEHRLLRAAVEEFAARDVAPRVRERDQEARFPTEEVADAARNGLLGLLVPEQDGGTAVGTLGAAIVYEEVARVSPSLSVILSVHNSLVCGALVEYGGDELKARLLPQLASGALLGAYALTESQAGSDAAAIRTSALKAPDGYRISGRKQFITSGAHAGLYIVFAVTDPAASTSRRISAFAVEASRPGVRVVRVEPKLGLRASEIVELEFDDVLVPPDHRLGQEGYGFGIAMSLLNGGRIGIGAQSVGIARGAFERALRYAGERQQFGQPIGHFEAIQIKLADMAMRISAARLLVYRAAWLRDSGQEHALAASEAKLFASEAAVAVADAAVQIHGGYGYLEEFEVERYLRDARATTLYEGTSEIQRLVIARRLLAGQN
ncbi:MAG TPA: acyl-CoA dehydrogenase family protein [Nitrolancea sp.]|nr:acyl-CoA dehydrogenase family protein [Nitrolancea sp.]